MSGQSMTLKTDTQNIQDCLEKSDTRKKGLVSIITPTYNKIKYLTLLIDSVFKYTKDFELIIVDNGSTDGTVEYLKGLEQSGKVKVIYNDHNVGFPKANNQAAEIAEGEYLCLCNNDVIVTEGWLDKLLRVIRSDAKLAGVGPYTSYSSGYQASKEVSDLSNLQEFARNYKASDKEVDFLVFYCCLIKRSIWDEIGGLDERMGLGNYEDNLFCYLAVEKGYKFKVVNCYVHHFGSMSWKEKSEDYVKIMARNQKIFHRTVDKYKTVSLCMIIADTESVETLRRCLKSCVDFVDNVKVVFNYKLFKNPLRIKKLLKVLPDDTEYRYLKWTNFSDMRNKCLDLADKDYVLSLDCDDVVLGPQIIRDLIFLYPDIDAFKCRILSKTETGGEELIIHNRLFKNKKEYRYRNLVHEDITFSMLENKAKEMITSFQIAHLGNVNFKNVIRKNKRNYKLMMKEFKQGTAHQLTYYQLINTLLLDRKNRNYLKSVKLVDECLDKFKLEHKDPLTSKLWVLRGMACGYAKQYLAAKQAFHKAWDEWRHPEAGVYLADIYIKDKNYDVAITILEELYNKKTFEIGNIPFDFKHIEMKMLELLGNCYSFKKNYKDAEKVYRECLSIEIRNLVVADRLAQILRNTKRIGEANRISSHMVNLFPTYFVGWANLGADEIMAGRYVTAKLFLEKALEINPDHEEARLNLENVNLVLKGKK